ncbi:glycoside hydrolase family 47 protein [Streptacidiphilus sp. MAP5-3]|uniref:glycoside hydrolase family 47 protein n=1 Tax=unclassified Streptacidiphilus TaxID=2643834 RepID=UPI0035143451
MSDDFTHAQSLPRPSLPSRRLLLGSAAGGVLLGAASSVLAAPAFAVGRPIPARPTPGAARRPVKPVAAKPGAKRPAVPAVPADAQAAAAIKAEYLHGWNGYCAKAWGHDELMPLSGGHNDFFAPGHTFGLSMVEALDTLYVMGCDAELARSQAWVEAHLDPTQDVDIHVFEAVIRLVGGLLASHLATRSKALLTRARELADRLLPAFTSSPTGIPYTHVNLRTGQVQGREVPLAEAGTSMMEFGLLSRLVGDSRYYDASLRAYRAVLARRSALDLLGTTIDAETGRWLDRTSIAPNPPADSFCEYLWGGGKLLNDAQLTQWYRMLTRAVQTHQTDVRGGLPWYHPVDATTGARTGGTVQSELASFYAGLLGKGGDLPRGEAYFRSWTAVLDRHPVLPETIDYATFGVVDCGAQLRPEYANSAFDLWRLTRDPGYKAAAWRWFENMRTHHRVAGGYTVIDDMRPARPVLGDLTPGYWFAENLKYLWLMFSGTPRFDYRTGILSTEGKILAGVR